MASIFVNGYDCLLSDRHGLKEPQKVEELQTKIVGALRDHCTYNVDAQKKRHLFARILGKIPYLRTLSHDVRQYLVRLKRLGGGCREGVTGLSAAPAVVEKMLTDEDLF